MLQMYPAKFVVIIFTTTMLLYISLQNKMLPVTRHLLRADEMSNHILWGLR